jgi:hypothetical protein
LKENFRRIPGKDVDSTLSLRKQELQVTLDSGFRLPALPRLRRRTAASGFPLLDLALDGAEMRLAHLDAETLLDERDIILQRLEPLGDRLPGGSGFDLASPPPSGLPCCCGPSSGGAA